MPDETHNDDKTRLISLAEAAKLYGFSALYLSRLAKRGRLKARKISIKNRRYAPGPAQEALHAARTEQREALFATVKERYAQGVYTTDIAEELNLSRKTISRWVNSETLPQEADSRRNA